MIKKRMEDELNKQINAEFYSSYLYLSMAAYFEEKNLAGFSNWMNVQAQEEWAHGLKIFNFVNERGGSVKLMAIDAPKNEWNNIIEVFEDVYAHEQKITGLINSLIDVAIEEADHATKNFLQWFIDEQVEEEASVSTLLEQIKMIDGKGTGLFMLDRELGSRTFTALV
ncbi:MAG: ferritin [Melioribacteraceae bacterium]|nr:ferritin [Melioribacteraceae bacterium]